MSMSDIVSGLGTTSWPIAGLLLFAGLFAAIVFRTFRMTPPEEHDEASRIPLDEDTPVTPR